MTHGDLGCAVTPKWRIFRRPWPITSQAGEERNGTVGMTRKSIGVMFCS